MLLKFVEYFVLGFAISAVPGAVLIETIRRCLADHRSVLKFLVGNFGGMIFVMAAAYFGATRALSGPVISVVFYLLSAGMLIYLGVSAYRGRPRKVSRAKTKKHPAHSALIVGVLLAVANPLSIVFWVSTMARIAADYGRGANAVLILAAILLGSLALFAGVVVVASSARNRLKDANLVILSRVFGVVLVGFGLLAAWGAFGRLS